MADAEPIETSQLLFDNVGPLKTDNAFMYMCSEYVYNFLNILKT